MQWELCVSSRGKDTQILHTINHSKRAILLLCRLQNKEGNVLLSITPQGSYQIQHRVRFTCTGHTCDKSVFLKELYRECNIISHTTYTERNYLVHLAGVFINSYFLFKGNRVSFLLTFYSFAWIQNRERKHRSDFFKRI